MVSWRTQFCNFRISCSAVDLPAYNLIIPVINSFNGEVEKFYPNFYKVLVDAEDIFRELDLSCIHLVEFEVNYADDVVHRVWYQFFC